MPVFLRLDTTFQLGYTQVWPLLLLCYHLFTAAFMYYALTIIHSFSFSFFFQNVSLPVITVIAISNVAFAVRFACVSGTSNTWNFATIVSSTLASGKVEKNGRYPHASETT